MKIMKIPPPSLWPSSAAAVLAVASDWYDAGRVAVDTKALAALELPPLQEEAAPTLEAGKVGMDLSDHAELCIALNSINYQFWDLDEKGQFVRYQHEGIVGALGMEQAFERAWDDPQSPISRARRGTPLTLADIHATFGDIPDPQSRVDILNEVLTSPHLANLGKLTNAMVRANGVLDTNLASQLADAFPLAYGDPVLKKAQLAVSQVWVKAREKGMAVDCDLTAFADYQIPNVLRALGVLDYSPSLAARIDAMQVIDYDSPDERAIRAASLLAVDRLAKSNGVPVAAVDHYLWARRKEATTPFHLTFTTAY